MAGTEKKGLFGKLFGRKGEAEANDTPQQTPEKTAETEAAPEPSPSREAPPTEQDEVQDLTTDEAADDETPRLGETKTDIVELEMDIPEEEISTVALSLEDLKVTEDEDSPESDVPQLALDADLGEEIQLETTEITETTEIKLSDSGLMAAVHDEPPASEAPTGEISHDEAASDDSAAVPRSLSDVESDLASEEDDLVPEIELDLDEDEEEERPVVAAHPATEDSISHDRLDEPAPPPPEDIHVQDEAPEDEPIVDDADLGVDLEVEEDAPVDFSDVSVDHEPEDSEDEQELSVTSSEVAVQYGFPEYVAPDEVSVDKAVPDEEPGKEIETLQEVSATGLPLTVRTFEGVSDIPLGEAEDIEDLLGCRSHVAALAGFATNSMTPLSISIQGEPGSGKTSLMRLIEAELDTNVCLTAWFSAGDYARFGEADEAPIAMIRRFLQALETNVPEDQAAKMRNLVDGAISYVNALWKVGSVFDARSIATVEIDEMDDAVSSNGEIDPVVGLKEKLREIVQEGLRLTARERFVVFIDDVNRLNPALTLDLLEVIHVFLSVDQCVFVVACDPEAVEKATGIEGSVPAEDTEAQRAYFERVFQLSFNVVGQASSMKDFIRQQLESIRFDRSDRTVEDYANLVRYSVGFSPRKIKRLVNRLALANALSPEVCSTGETGTAPQVRNQKMLFALACLESEFNAIFQLLLIERNDSRSLMRLIDEHLREAGQIRKLDARYGLFSGATTEESRIDKVIAFVDGLSGILYDGDENRRLEREDIALFGRLIDLTTVTAVRTAETTEEDPRRIALTEFCSRVRNRLAVMLSGIAPDRSDKSIRGPASSRPWFGLWYSESEAKQLWGPRRLNYELSFDTDNRDAVAVSLRCDSEKLSELGIGPTAVSRLKRLPLLDDKGFRVKDYDSGILEVTKVLHECSCSHIDQIDNDEVVSVAEEFKDLVQATHNLFDVRMKTKTPRPASPQPAKRAIPPCKVCGQPLEQVTTKSGGTGFKCATCRKVYKAKSTAKSTG